MKKTIATAVTLAILTGSIGAGTAYAAQHKGPKLPGFEMLDANGDGMITMEEINGDVTARFQRTDTNGDGFMDADELKAALGNRPERPSHTPEERAAKLFGKADANGDGLLTQDELRGPLAKHFTDADSNGDGTLDRDEVLAALARAEAARPPKPTLDERVAKLIAHSDKDGDGMISMDEAKPARGLAMFTQADANGDGSVTKAEWDAAIAAHRGNGDANGDSTNN